MKAQVMKMAHSIAKTMTGKYATRLSISLKQAWAQVKGVFERKLADVTPSFMKLFLAMPFPQRVATAKEFGIVAKFVAAVNDKANSLTFVSDKQAGFFKKLYSAKIDSTCVRYICTYAFAAENGKSYDEALASAKVAFSDLYKILTKNNVSLIINSLR